MEAYEVLTRSYPGWSLTEIREMTSRERAFWITRYIERVARGGVKV